MTYRNIRMGQFLYGLLLFFIAISPAYAAQNIKINIPEVIYSSNDSFTLGQIAKISGGNTKTRNILSSLMLYADNNVLSRNEVLRAINDSEASDARIELYMPSYSRIEAPAYEGNFTETSEPTTTQNKSRSVNELVPLIKSLAAWNGNVEVSANAPVPDGELVDPASIIPGTGAATLRFRDNNGKLKSLAVRLTWTQNVMVASHNINKGDKIKPQDLMSKQMKISRPGMYPSNPNEIINFTANKNIKQGEPILLSNVTSSSLIKRGRQVKIIARFGSASATVDGILMEDGRPGDWVKVRRVDDKKVTLRAKIINENSVEVSVE